MRRKIVLLAILTVVLFLAVVCITQRVAASKNEAVKETVTTLLTERFQQVAGLSNITVSDIIYTKVQGNAYVGSAKVKYSNAFTGSDAVSAVSFDMIYDGKTVSIQTTN